MQMFRCSQCHHVIYFEGTQCVHCGSDLSFLPDVQLLCAVQTVPNAEGAPAQWRVLGDVPGVEPLYGKCSNQLEHGLCNWAVPVRPSSETAEAQSPTSKPLCAACELNVGVPDLAEPANLSRWQQLENGKRRLLYSLMRHGLNFRPKSRDPAGLAFEFAADGEQRVVTGHADGLITINLAEADPVWREQMRENMGETYRTVLGHFRHEIGHYYWDQLIKGSPRLAAFRAAFGDERADYTAALESHYAKPPGARSAGFVSAYACMHPWEDWAETWAHYLHMVDTLETARSYGLAIERNVAEPVQVGELQLSDFEQLIRGWGPVSLALNSLNRSMGQPDPYPFTLDDVITSKLRFVHEVIHGAKQAKRVTSDTASAT